MMNETMAKTFSNNVETIMLMIGILLYLYSDQSALYDHLIPVCLLVSFTIRCTSAVGWLFLIVCHILNKKKNFFIYIYVGIPCLYLLMLPDYLYYGKWHILALNFVMFNIIEGKAEYFGSSPPMAYLEGYIPDHMGLLYPFAAFGFFLLLRKYRTQKEWVVPLTLGVNLLIYSFTGHKETRYIMHIVPYIIMMGGYGFSYLYENYKKYRKILGIVFWLIIWVNMVLFTIKVGGRPHTYRMYNRLLETHNPEKPSNLGVFTDCFQAPHNILLHNTNITFRTTDCMPMITRDNVRTVMAPIGELYMDYLNDFDKKTKHERLDYFIVNEDIVRYEKLLPFVNQFYDLVSLFVKD